MRKIKVLLIRFLQYCLKAAEDTDERIKKSNPFMLIDEMHEHVDPKIQQMIKDYNFRFTDLKYFNFNINDYVKVKLTEKGRQHYIDYHKQFGIIVTVPKEEEDGYNRFQMHNLMDIYGGEMYLSNDLVFHTDILIQLK